MGSNLFNYSHVLTFHSTAKWNAHFEAFKETNKLMVIDFSAKWCGPCKLMDPVMKDFAAKYTDVEFINLDVDELMGVSQTFQVYSLPTFLLTKKGKIVERVVGVRKEELQRMIEKHRN
ncbi:thioredoxin H2 [Trifolium repens]|nr:thioredoxin H2 [Trifolium repens]